MTEVPPNQLDAAFAVARAAGRTLLLPYLCAGFPSLAESEAIFCAMADAGADGFEVGIPFSDPIMDGPVIAAAAQHALANGTRLGDVLDLLSRLPDVPRVAMSYVNPILRYGVERYAGAAGQAGASGLIAPDLPLEEAPAWSQALEATGQHLVLFAAPTSTTERLAEIGRLAAGFIYCVSLLGVTGEREVVAATARDVAARVRSVTAVPAVIGVGISTPEQAAAVADVADGVIVGSALARRISDAGPGAAGVRAAAAFVRDLRRALDAA